MQPAWGLDEVDEYALKAVFLFNLAKFISWPDSTFANAEQKFRFCILGETKFNGDMKRTIEGEKINARAISVEKEIELDSSSYSCQILFISPKEASRLSEIMDFFKDYPVLTVSDLKDFANLGGMVEFYKENLYKEGERIRLAININALQGAKLQANANLLRVAKLISPIPLESP